MTLHRTGENHGITDGQQYIDQYTVDETPTMDFAKKALLDAQSRYFEKWPEQRKYAPALLWNLHTTNPRST